MNKNIRWLQYSIGLILLIISLICIFNYKVDSSGVFGHSNYLSKAARALTSGKMIAGLQNIDDRLFQDLIIKNLQVRNDVIAIGSSTTMHLRKGVVLKDRINFFNHSVNGASLEDYIAIVGAYESIHGYLPSTIILGVDSWVFNKNNGQGRWVGLKKYYDYELDKIYGKGLDSSSNSKFTINAIKWKQLINFEYTVSNIKFFIRTLLKNDDINPPLPLKESKSVEVLTKSELEKLSDRELILKAINSGIANKIEFGGIKVLDPTVPSYEKEVANREELIEVLAESSVSILAPPLMVNDLKFYIVDTTDTDDFIRADDGSIYYPNKIRYKSNDKVKVDAVAFAKYNPYSLGKYDNLNNIKLFEDFVRYLQLNKVDVTLFLPPYNPITYDLLLESNKYNIILTAEKYLINFAKLNDLDLKGSYNPHKYEFSNEDFFDGVHGRDRVFKKIFQPVL